MSDVVGVRFKPCGKIYNFAVDGIDLAKGDTVVVESELGLHIGNVVTEPYTVEDQDHKLKKIIRKATEEDILQKQENKQLEEEARDHCLERIMARGLQMKLISTEATLDKRRIVFFFTADKRIDFRELVKDLASKFKTRIEMRQIGVRDSARLIGSLGICGREVCCKNFLISFEPISIKMAKKQELVLNTGKLSGACGRLMCCLGFEYSDTYPENIVLEDEQIETISVDEEADEGELIVATSESITEPAEPAPQPQPQQQPEPRAFKKKKRRWRPRRRKKKKTQNP
jgi:cell fate regulator YaaT (PSP1 superfamily)